jgi:hypothetical protein
MQIITNVAKYYSKLRVQLFLSLKYTFLLKLSSMIEISLKYFRPVCAFRLKNTLLNFIVPPECF